VGNERAREVSTSTFRAGDGDSPAEFEGTPLGVALSRMAEAEPDRVAVVDGTGSATRMELERRSNRLARAYLALGLGTGSLAMIGLPNGIPFIEAVYAVWKLGATPLPVARSLSRPERDALIELAQPAIVAGFDDAAPGPAVVPAAFSPDPGLSDEPLPAAVASCWKAPASGGSTGRPKVVVSTVPGLLELLEPGAFVLDIRPGDVMLTTGPLHHNGPFMTTMLCLLTGGTAIVMPRFDAAMALELIARHHVTWMYAVPTMMQRIWRLPEEVRTAHDLSSLRSLLHMAAPCPVWLKRAWIEWIGPDRVRELYGGTEGQAFTVIGGRDWLAHPGSVGRPYGEISVRDQAGAELPAGEVGKVWLRPGPGLAAPYRYIGAEAERLEDGWECLGDVGYVDVEGYLYLMDRDTDMILVGGANVYPAEIEAALDQHPQVLSSCVVGLPDDDLGSVPHALVQLRGEVTDDELRVHLAARLAPYKLPRSFERVAEPLRDDAGKVRRSHLRAERLRLRQGPGEMSGG